MTRVVSYLRVSTGRQAEPQGEQAAMEWRDAEALELKEMVNFVDWTKAPP